MRTNIRSVALFWLVFVSAIFFMTSQVFAALTAEDVANEVKAAIEAGATAEDAVKSAVTSAIIEGMSTRDAAAAALMGTVEAAVALGLSSEEIREMISACALGARAAAEETGQDAAAIDDGLRSGAESAAAIHELDPATLLAAVAAGIEAYSPPGIVPGPTMPAPPSDPIAPTPDPTGSPI